MVMRYWPALDFAPPDDLIHAALTEFDVAAIDDNAPDRWRVFFHTFDGRDAAVAALRDRFPAVSVSAIDIPDEDWAARSQANLKAVRVGNIVVAPPWDVPVTRDVAVPQSSREVAMAQDVSEPVAQGFSEAAAAQGFSEAPVAQGFSPAITIIIQPSMGFGTGHHATTRLCLAHMQNLDLRGRSAIDVGTGSGVLAIAASRLGAARVLAIDDDPDAIQSARENVDLNPGAGVSVDTVDLRRDTLPPFDLVLANLTGGLLVAAAPALHALAAPGGRLILSGFMESEHADVQNAFSAFAIEARSQEDEWVCVTLASSS